jgi:hypothetical protein
MKSPYAAEYKNMAKAHWEKAAIILKKPELSKQDRDDLEFYIKFFPEFIVEGISPEHMAMSKDVLDL